MSIFFLKSFTKFLTTSQENLQEENFEQATSKVARSQNSSPRGNVQRKPRVSMSPCMSSKRLLPSGSSSCENQTYMKNCASCHETIDEKCYVCLSCSNENPRICQNCFIYHQKMQALSNHEVYISVLLNSWEWRFQDDDRCKLSICGESTTALADFPLHRRQPVRSASIPKSIHVILNDFDAFLVQFRAFGEQFGRIVSCMWHGNVQKFEFLMRLFDNCILYILYDIFSNFESCTNFRIPGNSELEVRNS